MPKASRSNKKTAEKTNSATLTSKFPVKINKLQALILIAILVVIGILYNFKSLFIVATVNGEPISRISIVKELEKQGGKQTLNSLITKTLVLQEAKKQNVTVSNDEVNNELKKVEDSVSKRGQKLDDVLSLQGTTRLEFIGQIRMQKMVEKMIGKDIKVTDKEIDDYMEKNKEFIQEGTDSADLRNNVKEQLNQQKLGDKFQKWLSDLQKNAKINYFVNY